MARLREPTAIWQRWDVCKPLLSKLIDVLFSVFLFSEYHFIISILLPIFCFFNDHLFLLFFDLQWSLSACSRVSSRSCFRFLNFLYCLTVYLSACWRAEHKILLSSETYNFKLRFHFNIWLNNSMKMEENCLRFSYIVKNPICPNLF